MLNSILSSSNSSKNLSAIQKSILKEEKRLRFGEQTIQYSIHSLNLKDLPDILPHEVIAQSSRYAKLTGCSFYEMLTYAVWQYLLTNQSTDKDEVIKRIRKQVVQKTFMQQSPSTKGLVIKGIKQMQDYAQQAQRDQLIAHCMWKNDSMFAFSEFWKSLFARLKVRNIVDFSEKGERDVGLLQLAADFLQINVCVFYGNNKTGEFDKQLYPSRRRQSSLKLNIVAYMSQGRWNNEPSRILSQSIALSQSQQKPQEFYQQEWNYLIFEEKSQHQNHPTELSREDISEIRPVDESVEEKEEIIKLFRLKTKSELNLQRPANINHYQDEVMSPYSINAKSRNRALETTRTKKSIVTTTAKFGNDYRNCGALNIDFQQTKWHLSNIRKNIQLGQKLVNEMKQFCHKITS